MSATYVKLDTYLDKPVPIRLKLNIKGTNIFIAPKRYLTSEIPEIAWQELESDTFFRYTKVINYDIVVKVQKPYYKPYLKTFYLSEKGLDLDIKMEKV